MEVTVTKGGEKETKPKGLMAKRQPAARTRG